MVGAKKWLEVIKTMYKSCKSFNFFYISYFIYLGQVLGLCGHKLTRAVICRVHDSSRTQMQRIVTGFDLVSVILLGIFGLSVVPHATDCAVLAPKYVYIRITTFTLIGS